MRNGSISGPALRRYSSAVATNTGRLFGKVQVVAEPLPGLDLLDGETGVAVCERREEEEAP